MLRGLPLALLALGLAARLAPLFEPGDRGLRQFPSEDGYLMLTIARNMALGRGMSIAAGEIPTNGTQPFMSGVYALAFWLVNGDRTWGVWLSQLTQAGIAVAAALVLFAVVRRMLAGHPAATRVTALTAGLWFAGPVAVKHTQNCLETGAYALACLCIALYSLRLPAGGRDWPLRRCMLLGTLLALAFWVRNDAALLVAAVCLARVLPALRLRKPVPWRRWIEATVIGATALSGAFPWLLNNRLGFGYWMPISGVSEGTHVTLGENLGYLPAPLAEYASVILQIPSQLERHPFVIGGCSLVVLLNVLGAVAMTRRLTPRARAWMAVVGLWALLFVAFYGIRFGVGFFISRYFFPLSPYLALTTVFWIDAAWRASALSRVPVARALVGLSLLVVIAGLDLRLYLRGTEHQHFQVVEWVEKNVPDAVWVGAVQTGTLGFFHDRTINLDGKVNPYALQARLAQRIHEYVPATPIEYLADWPGIEQWLDKPGLRGRFELYVNDPEQRLVVLRRVEPVPPSVSPAGGYDRP